MALAGREQAILDGIEARLNAEDPGLAALLAADSEQFFDLDERPQEQRRRWWRRRRRPIDEPDPGRGSRARRDEKDGPDEPLPA